jgi:hypothetical protein
MHKRRRKHEKDEKVENDIRHSYRAEIDTDLISLG